MSVDGSSGPMEMVSVNIPAGVFRTVDLLRTFFSAAAISPHLCLSATLLNTNAPYTTTTALFIVLLASLLGSSFLRKVFPKPPLP